MDDKENNLNNNEKNYSFSAYSIDNNLYIINLFIENDFLNLKCKKNRKMEYLCKATYDELKNVKILSTTENLEQIFNFIKENINNNYKMNNYPLIIKETNEIILAIPIKIENNNDLMFKLEEKERNLNEINKQIIFYKLKLKWMIKKII